MFYLLQRLFPEWFGATKPTAPHVPTQPPPAASPPPHRTDVLDTTTLNRIITAIRDGDKATVFDYFYTTQRSAGLIPHDWYDEYQAYKAARDQQEGR